MIMKIFKLRPASTGPRDTVNYILGITNRKTMAQSESCEFLINNGYLIPFNICSDGDSPEKIAMLAQKTAVEMADIARRNPRVKKPYWHAMISLPPQDSGRLSNKDWVDIVDTVMTRLGFSSCVYIAAVHRDTDAEHIHIAACTVQDEPNYAVVKRLGDYQIAEEAMREIEKQYGLTKVAPSSESGTIDSPTRNSRKQELRDTLDTLIDQALSTAQPTLLDLFELARSEKITLNFLWQNGRPNGVSYGHAGFCIPGSKLAAKGRYTLNGLLKLGFSIPTGNDLIALEAQTAPVGKARRRPSDEGRPPTREAAFCDYSLSLRVPTAAAGTIKKNAPTLLPSYIEQAHVAWERWHFLVRIRTWGKKKIGNALTFLAGITQALAIHLEKLLEALNQPTTITAEPPTSIANPSSPPTHVHDGPKTSPEKQALRLLHRPVREKHRSGHHTKPVIRPAPSSRDSDLPFDL